MAKRFEHPTSDDPSRFTEPSEAVKRRNRTTGLILLGVVLALIALSMIVRVYGS